MNDTRFPKFQSFYNSLVHSAASRGIVQADAEDIAADAIERGLAGFDPAKGDFPAYCHTILANLMKNYWRDKKKTEPYPEEDGPADPGSEFSPMELAEAIGEIRSALDTIRKKLSSEENNFLKHLQDVLDESGPRAISEAARRSGLTPARGWDLFRKIQRKARGKQAPLKFNSLTSESVSRIEIPRMQMPAKVVELRSVFRTAPRTTPSRFTPEQLEKIESLLP